MHRYRVTDVSAEDARIALRDSAGKVHVALAMNDLPAVGIDLHGSVPGLGFRVLMCRLSDRLFRVVFEKIDCGSPLTPGRGGP